MDKTITSREEDTNDIPFGFISSALSSNEIEPIVTPVLGQEEVRHDASSFVGGDVGIDYTIFNGLEDPNIHVNRFKSLSFARHEDSDKEQIRIFLAILDGLAANWYAPDLRLA